MNSPLQSWQRSAIRNSMERYRRAQEDYYGKGKALGRGRRRLQGLLAGQPAAGLARDAPAHPADRGQHGAERQRRGRRGRPHAARHHHRRHLQLPVRLCPLLGGGLPAEDRRATAKRSATTNSRAPSSRPSDLGTTCVILTGGEPLLFPRIYDLIARGGPLAKRLHHFHATGNS